MKDAVKLELDYIREGKDVDAAQPVVAPLSKEAEVRRIAGLNLQQVHLHEIDLPDREFVFRTKSKSMISLGFMLKGFGSSVYEGVQQPMEQSPMSFNVMFQSGLAAEHTMWGDKGFHFIHLGISNEKFMSLLSACPDLYDHYATIMDQENFYLFHGSQSPKMPHALTESLNTFRRIDSTNNLCGLLLESSLLSLIAYTHASRFTADTTCKDSELMQEIKEYLQQNYLEPVTLKLLSKEFGINEYLIKSSFKKYFNTTVFTYLQQLRMAHAKELLLSGLSVKEVAAVIGYEYPHHFSTAFTRYYGLNPSKMNR